MATRAPDTSSIARPSDYRTPWKPAPLSERHVSSRCARRVVLRPKAASNQGEVPTRYTFTGAAGAPRTLWQVAPGGDGRGADVGWSARKALEQSA